MTNEEYVLRVIKDSNREINKFEIIKELCYVVGLSLSDASMLIREMKKNGAIRIDSNYIVTSVQEEIVYEVIDQTYDETYYPLGLFKSLEEAKKEIMDSPKDYPIFEMNDEYEKIVIKEREFGWTEGGRPVFTINRRKVYDDETDEEYWEFYDESGIK